MWKARGMCFSLFMIDFILHIGNVCSFVSTANLIECFDVTIASKICFEISYSIWQPNFNFFLFFPLHFRNNGKKTVRSYTLWLWISIWQYNVNIFLSVKMCTPLSRWYSHKLLVLFLLLRLFGYCFGACAAEVKSSWDDSNWCKSCVSFGNIITSRNDISKRKHVKGANFVCSSRGFHFLFVYFGCIRRDDAKQVVFEKDWIDRRAWWCC